MMYKVIKELGANQNVILENNDTHAQIMIGRITPKILEILNMDKLEGDDRITALKSQWHLDITAEQAKELSKLTLSMSKPPKKKKTVTQEQKKIINSKIDAVDVMLGLAKYNK